jgi:hypothetical protein
LRLDLGLRLGYLLAHLRLCCVAVDGKDVWAIFVGLVDLEILRTVAAAEQSLAMHIRVSLFDPRLQSLLLNLTWSPTLLRRRPSLVVLILMLLHALDAP